MGTVNNKDFFWFGKVVVDTLAVEIIQIAGGDIGRLHNLL